MNIEIPFGLCFLLYGAWAVRAWKTDPEHKRFNKLRKNTDRWGEKAALAYHFAWHVGVTGALGIAIVIGSIQAGP